MYTFLQCGGRRLLRSWLPPDTLRRTPSLMEGWPRRPVVTHGGTSQDAIPWRRLLGATGWLHTIGTQLEECRRLTQSWPEVLFAAAERDGLQQIAWHWRDFLSPWLRGKG
ncbi:unnamed protein product [Boreogadus saida]